MNPEKLLSPHLLRIFQTIKKLSEKEPEMHIYQITSALECGIHVLMADLLAFENLGLIEPGSKIATLKVVQFS